MVEITPSLLSVKEDEDIVKLIHDLEMAYIGWFHIDVMDGKFVPKNTLERMMNYSTTIKQISNLPLDIHLMVKKPKKFIDEYLALEPNIITFHIEATKNEKETLGLIQYIKENGSKVGISIKPATKVERVFKYLDKIHMVLVMSVEPGLGGQELIPETVDKVKALKKYIDDNNLEVDIQVDGGIKIQNAGMIKRAGANILVAGTAVVGAEDKQYVVNKLKRRECMRIKYNDELLDIQKGSRITDVLKDEITGNIITAAVNNEIRSLGYELNEECEIKLLDTTNKDGSRVYIRGLLYIMSKAFKELYPEALLTINHSLTNAMFCEIDKLEITEEVIQNVDKRMREIIEQDLAIRKVIISKEEAEELYKKENVSHGRLQVTAKPTDTITLYYCEDYFNYFFGVMPISTGYIKKYNIVKYGSRIFS